MGGQSTSSSESSLQAMETFHLPPPPPRHSKGRKHHRHRHHSRPPPPSPSGHRHNLAFEHFPLGRIPHHHLPFLLGRPDYHHHKDGLKPPKHLKKVHKLQRKIMKAYKLPKGARHGAHYCRHMRFPPPPEEGAPSWHRHSPGCCLHISDAMDHHRPRCHGRHPHLRRPSRPLDKLDVSGVGILALEGPQAMEISAELPIEGGTMLLTSDMTPADEPAPVVQAP